MNLKSNKLNLRNKNGENNVKNIDDIFLSMDSQYSKEAALLEYSKNLGDDSRMYRQGQSTRLPMT